MIKKKALSINDRIIGIFLIICLTLLQGLGIPGSYGITSVIFIISVLNYISDKRIKKIFLSWPLSIWLALTIYHYVNAQFIHHVPETNIVDLLHGLRLYSCIIIFVYFACIDYKGTVKLLLDAYIIKSAIVLLFLFSGGYSAGERLTGAGASATGLGQNAALCCIFLVYYNSLVKLSILKNVQYLIIPLTVILLSQTRNALAMAVISIAMLQVVRISRVGKPVILTSLLTVISMVLVFGVVFYFLQDSALASRFVEGSEYEDYKLETGTVFDKIVGDRLIYYVLGWSFFLTSPLTGIGMWNYKYYTGGKYPLHSEYMVHLCEGGIIGSVLWLSFVFFIIYIIWRYIKIKEYKLCAISSVFVLLFCAIYAREFFEEVFYPPYALIIAWYCSRRFFHIDLNQHLQRNR
jgi:hypothetical protein